MLDELNPLRFNKPTNTFPRGLLTNSPAPMSEAEARAYLAAKAKARQDAQARRNNGAV